MPRTLPKRSDHTALFTPPSPDREVRRHLRELGLERAHDYREWCRAHGFRPALNKLWRERREELRRRREEAHAHSLAAARAAHIRALSLPGEEDYRSWCERHGFGAGAGKSVDQLRREREARSRELAAAALSRGRSRQRRPEEIVAAIARSRDVEEALWSPQVACWQSAFASVEGPAREALRRLLLHALRRARLAAPDPVVPHLCGAPGNCFPSALAALARRYAAWRCPPEEWRPSTRSPRRQFHSLARHLLARYPVPDVLDAAWFEGDSPEAERHRDWFLHIGAGRNLRTADLPLRLTSRAAHFFLEAPPDLPIESALRWAQLRGMGADEYLVRGLLATRLRAIQADEPFWLSFFHFLINQPMIDPACLEPMVDYLHQIRFVRLLDGEGAGRPAEPEFSLKGRTFHSLWRRVEAWRRELPRSERRLPAEWHGSSIPPLELLEEEEGRVLLWSIRELSSAAELRQEGREMRHCVASYIRTCARGHSSIWSLRVEELATGRRRSVMTIELDNHHRRVVQARGRCNRRPGDRESSFRLERAPELLRFWAREQGLAIAPYL